MGICLDCYELEVLFSGWPCWMRCLQFHQQWIWFPHVCMNG